MNYIRPITRAGIVIFAVCFSCISSAHATSPPLHADLSVSLGFIIAQRLSLELIKDKYPSLSPRTELAHYKFNSSFGSAENNMKNALRDIAGERYNEVNTALESSVESTLSDLNADQISLQDAVTYLDEIEARAEGNIPSPILQTLLTYQFENKPVEEYIRGFKATYRTKKHPKSKGLDFQIEVPQSWSSSEGRRPNIIQLFTSNNGRGFVYSSIMVRNIAKEAGGELTLEDLEFLDSRVGSEFLASEMFVDRNLKELAKSMIGLSNVRNLQSETVVLDRWPGANVSFIGDGQHLDLVLTLYNQMYFVNRLCTWLRLREFATRC